MDNLDKINAALTQPPMPLSTRLAIVKDMQEKLLAVAQSLAKLEQSSSVSNMTASLQNTLYYNNSLIEQIFSEIKDRPL